MYPPPKGVKKKRNKGAGGAYLILRQETMRLDVYYLLLGHYTSPKLVCPVAFACACASACPVNGVLHVMQRKVKPAVSVNWSWRFCSFTNSTAASNTRACLTKTKEKEKET